MPKDKGTKTAAVAKKVKTPSCSFEQLSRLGVQSLKVGDNLIGTCQPRTFASGSYGLGYTGPALIQLPDGSVANCQVSVNIVVKHSGAAAKAAEGSEAVDGEAAA